MLYVTTRSDRDAFTAHYAQTHDLGPDGGQFLPRSMPCFTEADLLAAQKRTFSGNIAYVLAMLHRKPITGRDIELVAGKRILQFQNINSRTLVAETWHSGDCSFDEYVQRLFRFFVTDPGGSPSQWFVMSVRIAVIFAVFADLMARGIAAADAPLDVAVPSMDFQFPMAFRYARSWGVPIGDIICACNENNAPWSLLHQGVMRTDIPVRHTCTAACDQAVPAGMERLISDTLGMEEAQRYAQAVQCGWIYKLELPQRECACDGLAVSVVSQRRMAFMIPNLYRSGRWMPDPYSAMAYAALVDHRAHTGRTGKALIISEQAPVHAVQMLSEMLDITPDELRSRLGEG